MTHYIPLTTNEALTMVNAWHNPAKPTIKGLRVPSVDTLVKSRLCDGANDPKALAKLVRATLKSAGRGECVDKLREVDKLIGGFGVEYVKRGHNRKSPEFYYVNMGDTYSATIVFVNGYFTVTSWGDIVERGRYD